MLKGLKEKCQYQRNINVQLDEVQSPKSFANAKTKTEQNGKKMKTKKQKPNIHIMCYFVSQIPFTRSSFSKFPAIMPNIVVLEFQ